MLQILTKQMFEKSAKLVSEQEDLIFGDDWLGESFMEICR